MSDFDIEDELYEIVGDLSQVQLLVKGEEERALAYTKKHGQGTVVYIALGHGALALANPNLQRMYVQAAHWLLNPPELEQIRIGPSRAGVPTRAWFRSG